MESDKQEKVLTNEVSKIVGYILPIFESLGANEIQKRNVKKILWTFKENLKLKLNQVNYDNIKNEHKN